MDRHEKFKLYSLEAHNLHKPFVVATLGAGILDMDYKRIIEKLEENNITHVRINLAKFETEQSINDLRIKLVCIRKKTSDAYKIMLDLPVPYKKARFYLPNNEIYVDVKRGDKLVISNNKDIKKEKILYLSQVDELFLKDIHVGEIIKYGDGECEFIVFKIEGNCIEVIVQNDAKLFTRKALSLWNKVLDNRKDLNNHKYTSIIKDVQPWTVAFSFIASKRDILDVKRYLRSINIETEIVSKIETLEAVNNISEILEESDVMIARGDLSSNVPPEDFYYVQEQIFKKAVNAKRKVYVATGILNSLSNFTVPTQSEIIDISIILNNNPQGIILNYGVVCSPGFTKALELISRMVYHK